MDEETREIVDCFVLECREALDEVEPMFIELEGADGPPPAELLARSFRLFHSVKGNAGYLHFSSIERVTHRAETLIDLIQKGTVRRIAGGRLRRAISRVSVGASSFSTCVCVMGPVFASWEGYRWGWRGLEGKLSRAGAVGRASRLPSWTPACSRDRLVPL